MLFVIIYIYYCLVINCVFLLSRNHHLHLIPDKLTLTLLAEKQQKEEEAMRVPNNINISYNNSSRWE